MSLQSELDAHRAGWVERVGAQNARMMADDIVAQAAMLGGARREGDEFPSIALVDHLGRPVDIAAGARQQPVVVTFYRGGWCPYCNLELRAFQKVLSAIEALGARLVAVSPELPDNSLDTAQKNALGFSVLSDSNGTLADALGIRYRLSAPVKAYLEKARIDLPARNGDDAWTLPVPATYIVARGGRIALAHIDTDYRKRLDPEAVLAVLKTLQAP
jgi:peroxiredoxin